MLIYCPECELQVSDKAISCPHCGYQLKPDVKPKRSRSQNKRRRLPNGFGQISEIKGRNLRKPFRAMVSVGKTSTGRIICKPLKPESYFPTYNDAYSALVEYHKNPYDLSPAITIKELYDKWTDAYFKTLKSVSSTRTITSAWAYCSSIYDMRVMDLRARHIKGCIDEGRALIKGEEREPTAGVKSRIKSMFNLMLDYALEYELTDKNYARTFNLSDDIIKEKEDAKRGHIPFKDEEIQILWDHVDTNSYVDIVLIQCYSGWRPQELGLLEIENVNLDEWLFTGGMKTEAGINRTVPIHSKIRPLVEKKYQEAIALGSKYLINCTDARTHRGPLTFTYDKYRTRFTKLVNDLKLNPQHRAHDGRVHFVTAAKKYKVDEYAIKYIVGHEIDESLLDKVAHTHLITPTDCAKFLISKIDAAWQRLHSYRILQLVNICGKRFALEKERLSRNRLGLERGVQKILDFQKQFLQLLEEKTKAANPKTQLKRGYTITKNESGKILRSAKDVSGHLITVFADGEVMSEPRPLV